MPTVRARINGAWIDVGVDEVFIGPDEPTDPNVELWVDEDDDSGGGGGGGGGGTDEVWIGPDDPYLTDPNGTWEVWVKPPISMVKSVCPDVPYFYAGAAFDKFVTFQGLEASKQYLPTVNAGAINGAGPKTADANGNLLVGLYSSTIGAVITLELHDGTLATDPVIASVTLPAITAAPTATTPAAGTVGVATTITASGFPPNWPMTLEIKTPLATPPTVAPALKQNTNASGSVTWTLTPVAAGSHSVHVWMDNVAGSACVPLNTNGEYYIYKSWSVT